MLKPSVYTWNMDDQDLLKKIATITNQAEKEDTLPIAQALKELDLFLDKNRAEIPPKLAHYLEKRSYVKAYEYLKNGEEK